MEKMSVHDKAVRLCEGGLVEIDGNVVRLVRCNTSGYLCMVCEMDCLCHEEMAEICSECENLIKIGCYLKLVTR